MGAWFRYRGSCWFALIMFYWGADWALAQLIVPNEEERILTIHALPGDYPPQANQPGIVPVSLLMRDYSTWTQAQRDLVPEKKFNEFRSLIPNRQGICQSADPTARHRPLSHAKFWETVEEEPVVLVGRVEAAEPAWDFIEHSARTILHFRVTAVLKNGGYYPRTVVADDLIYLLKRDGAFPINGGVQCSRYPPFLVAQASTPLSEESVVLGAEFLVAGSFGEHNRHFLRTVRTSRFLVNHGRILPPPGGWAEPPHQVALQDVVERLESAP